MNFPDFGQFFITRAHAQDATGLRYNLKDSSWNSASFGNCLSRWVRVGKMVLHKKLTKNAILRGLKLRRFTQNQINLHQKVSQNHRTNINSNKANFHEKTPTHISATYAITIFYQNF